MKTRKIAILGGSGFVGGHLVAALAERGMASRVITRRRNRTRHLLVIPSCEVVEGDIFQLADRQRHLAGCDAVVNLVGILNQGRSALFEDVHARLPASIAAACRSLDIGRIVHISALGVAKNAPSEYLRSKFKGEEAIHAAGGDIRVTSIRPSIIFGPGDSFFNRFANLLSLSPLAFPLACADARFAPVWVGDVIEAILRILDDDSTDGHRYELCGPEVQSLRDLVQFTADVTGKRRWIIDIGHRLSRLQGIAMQNLPGKIFTLDNYLSATVPSVCKDSGFAALGIEPCGIESIVPAYLGAREKNARLSRLRSMARRSDT
ncbi:complex I NDUFA9 subunit family protein [Thioalkalivibrio sp. HK1]|uniref:complex I NDUFA9 subunit family protein n=1 Tax=Thioalkalivibrio sp. HK1 TaxID=1469245 RepID=UPI000472B30E|nr:complex I NDUFA9 subunit family protein [Thioalkalivibrio sp. HK1]